MPTDHPTPDASKPLWKSKTFWANVLALAATYAPGLPIPPKVAVPIVAAVNIALRWITRGPVHLFD